jgi:hypothetical protein
VILRDDDGMIKTLECGCETETRSFGTQVRLCKDHKHLAADPRLRSKPDFSAERANDPTPVDGEVK